MPSRRNIVKVNRAPVLTLWAAVVAETLGHDRGTALTLGQAVAGMNARSKGRRLGIYPDDPPDAGEKKPAKPRPKVVELLGRRVPVARTRAGLRAVRDGTPAKPELVEKYLVSKLGDALPRVRAAMTTLARGMSPEELESKAYELYEAFRPSVLAGEKGWGASGVLDLAKIQGLGRRERAKTKRRPP